MMTDKMAQQIATDFMHKHKDASCKIGSHTTNGVERFVVHVTWPKKKEGERRRKALTIANPTQAF